MLQRAPSLLLPASGAIAKWLCSGLQSRLCRFDSGSRLQVFLDRLERSRRPGGETGRRKGLKIPRPQGHAGSTPAPGTRELAAPRNVLSTEMQRLFISAVIMLSALALALPETAWAARN